MLSALLKDLQKNIISYLKIKKNWELNGFTLIELLVVMAIIGLLTGGAIVAYNNFNQAQTVRRAALQVKTDLRESQNRAVSGLKHEICRADLWSEFIPNDRGDDPAIPDDNVEDYNLEGHFVTFDTTVNTEYKSAQGCVNNPSQETPIPGGHGVLYPGSTESIAFPGDVVTQSIRTLNASDTECATHGQLTINFRAPLKGTEPVEFYNGPDLDSANLISDPCAVKAEIVVSDGSTSFEVEVNISGQISEDKL
jgi:prepilin-type N-terminal cleavage/methylation domain-containing protein